MPVGRQLSSRSYFMVLPWLLLGRWRAENVRSEVANAAGNVKFNLNSLWTSPGSVFVRGGFVESPTTSPNAILMK